MPGTVTCLCGDPGCGKSFKILQACLSWHASKIKTCIFELEEDRAYHLNRALGITHGMCCLIDPDWIENNADMARSAVDGASKFLDEFGRHMWEAPQDQVSLESLDSWVKDRARAGYEIIVIDPITAASAEDKPWIADLEFLMSVKSTARQYGCRVVLVTHPKKGGKSGKGMDDMAGSAAYSRFSQTVLWLERYDVPKEVRVLPYGTAIEEWTKINRAVHIRKARNGKGAGMKIGFHFEGERLQFDELGMILPQTKNENNDSEEAS
jgi:RecA-family ATPase